MTRALKLGAAYIQECPFQLDDSGLTADRAYVLPNTSGTLALTTITSTKNGNYTVVKADDQTCLRFSGGSYTVTLSAVGTVGDGFTITIMNMAATSTHVLTIDPDGAELIDTKSTMTLYRGQGVTLVVNSGSWRIIGTIGYTRSWGENTDVNSTRPIPSGAESVAIGQGTTASGDYSVAIGATSGGVGSVASGLGSVALGGGEAASVGAFAFGQDVTSRSTRGGKAWGGGKITTAGDAQYRMQQVRGQTTNDTPLVLTADAAAASATNIFRLPNNSTYTYRVMVTGHRTDVAGRASYEFRGCIIRDANAASTALAGAQIKTVIYESTEGYDATVTADTTNGALIVTVTGAASHTMTWVAHIEAAEATN